MFATLIKPALASQAQGNNDKNKPVKTVASAYRDLTVVYLTISFSSTIVKWIYGHGIVWVAESQIHQQYLCVYVAFVALCHYNYNVYYWKKDQVLKSYVHCMTKLSIKHLLKSCGKWQACSCIIFRLTLNWPLICLM